jgi:hypothetical protein
VSGPVADRAAPETGEAAHLTGRPELRVAFVGQSVYFRQCSQELVAGGVSPSFIDFRAGAPAERLLAELVKLDPDLVLVFRPEIVPHGLFDSIRAITLGYLTEPLPRGGPADHPDLRGRLWWLEKTDPGNFDRIVSFDPLIAETAQSVLPVWRSVPLPVADSLFTEPKERSGTPRLLFIGRSTPHREELMAPLKRRHHVVHVGHGLYGQELARMLRDTDVQLNLHNNPYPSFENRVSIAMAAGHLVVSEPLSPTHGLQAGRDFLEVETAQELLAVADRLMSERAVFREVRLAGREQAERFRASAVYPALLQDAIADVHASGTDRRRS